MSARGFTAEMPALPAIIARWAAIGRQHRRVSGRGKDNAAARSAYFRGYSPIPGPSKMREGEFGKCHHRVFRRSRLKNPKPMAAVLCYDICGNCIGKGLR